MSPRLRPLVQSALLAAAATLPAWLALAPAGAAAQTVYRCGPDGREYSQRPCPAGTGREVDVADPRSEAARAAGEAEANRQREAAEDLAQQRRVYESQGLGQGLARPARDPATADAPDKAPAPTPRQASTTARERIRLVTGAPAAQPKVKGTAADGKARPTVKPAGKAAAPKKKPAGDSNAS